MIGPRMIWIIASVALTYSTANTAVTNTTAMHAVIKRRLCPTSGGVSGS